MTLEEKIKLLRKNTFEEYKKRQYDKIKDKYYYSKKLYEEVESSLKQGHVRVIVEGEDERIEAEKYFDGTRVACSGDCITQYSLELNEKGIIKLEKDYNKIKEAFEKYE